MLGACSEAAQYHRRRVLTTTSAPSRVAVARKQRARICGGRQGGWRGTTNRSCLWIRVSCLSTLRVSRPFDATSPTMHCAHAGG